MRLCPLAPSGCRPSWLPDSFERQQGLNSYLKTVLQSGPLGPYLLLIPGPHRQLTVPVSKRGSVGVIRPLAPAGCLPAREFLEDNRALIRT